MTASSVLTTAAATATVMPTPSASAAGDTEVRPLITAENMYTITNVRWMFHQKMKKNQGQLIMHYKDLLGSIERVGNCILVFDFYLVLHGV